MDQPGTVRAGISTLDPYMHAHVAIQIAEPLYIGIRQTAEVSDLNDDALRLYPGVDMKLRLLEEGPYHPELSLGWLGAVGHKRMAGEYLAASKRFDNWDISGGIGLGKAEDFTPLRFLPQEHLKDQKPCMEQRHQKDQAVGYHIHD